MIAVSSSSPAASPIICSSSRARASSAAGSPAARAIASRTVCPGSKSGSWLRKPTRVPRARVSVAALRPELPGHQPEEGALARPIGADQRQAVPLPDLERGAGQHVVAAIGVLEVGGLDQQRHEGFIFAAAIRSKRAWSSAGTGVRRPYEYSTGGQ